MKKQVMIEDKNQPSQAISFDNPVIMRLEKTKRATWKLNPEDRVSPLFYITPGGLKEAKKRTSSSEESLPAGRHAPRIE
jgi:hypothetical protein